ncbi:MAG: putative ABC transporter ATP-binding protein YheS [Ignavibacteria bacterium]|nr:putative ABC transporter ATP-binding protein YheS [Ignavibacteria bacterium]
MISLNNISMRFGAKVLFNDVSLRISGKDRISFVGSNGAGKSTLLKIICGLAKADEGEVAVSRHTTVGYLPQEGIVYTGKTLYEEVYSSAGDINKIQSEMEEIEKELSGNQDTGSDEYMDLLYEYGELQERFEQLEGFKLKSKIEKILTGLGFFEKDFDRLTDEFSGGWQMRIEIAKLLLSNPSILLLDEPTNHLDIESLIWVENYLINYQGAVVLVSHDRSFLDNITRRTLEISMGNVTEYSGNYSFYKKEKEIRKEHLENQFNNQQKYLRQQERFIERFRYKATKARQVQSRIKQLDKVELVEIEDEESSVNFRFPPATHSGKISLEISDLTKNYDGVNNVIENINLLIGRGEKIAFVGVNGAGKSTLMRIIARLENFQKGDVKIGHLVTIKFYAQNQAEALNPEKTVLQTMEESATGEITKNLRSILGSFLFRGDDVFKKVGVLSGGEKSRLALAKMLIEQSNFLVLDEPTNHLDMRSKEVLMNALQKYEGTVVIVSHDREFIDGIVDKVIEVKNKNIKTYYGNAADYLKAKENELKKSNNINDNLVESRKSDVPKIKNERNVKANPKSLIKEMNKKIESSKSRLKVQETEILKIENEIKTKENLMSGEEFYKGGYNIMQFTGEYNLLKDKLKNKYTEWETETAELAELESKLAELKSEIK